MMQNYKIIFVIDMDFAFKCHIYNIKITSFFDMIGVCKIALISIRSL